MKFPYGEYIFCELPDGTIGGFPSWIADVAAASDFTVGTPLASAEALAELCELLNRLHSDLKHDKASLEPMLQEPTNDTKGNAIDDADESAVLQQRTDDIAAGQTTGTRHSPRRPAVKRSGRRAN